MPEVKYLLRDTPEKLARELGLPVDGILDALQAANEAAEKLGPHLAQPFIVSDIRGQHVVLIEESFYQASKGM
jgi:hypothetical protein